MATPARAAFRNAAFWLKTNALRRTAGATLHRLEANEQLPASDVAALQRNAAGALVAVAYDRSSFYRRWLDNAGVDPTRAADGVVWATIPPVTRTDLKRAGEARLTTAMTPAIRIGSTSGSTGEPLTTYQDASVPGLPLYWRMIRWWRVHPADHVVHVGRWGHTDWRRRLQHWPSREILFDAVRFDRDDIDELIDTICRVRPSLVEGYVGAMQEIARRIRERGIDIPPPKAVATTASPLTMAARHELSTAFGAPVFDQYRSAEIPWIAAERRSGEGLHVFADCRLLEIVDDDGQPVPDGTEGNVLLTDLTNSVAPLIRYRIGDRGTLRAAARQHTPGFPILEPINGRIQDVLRLPDGTAITAGFPSLFDHDPGAVRSFRIHQHTDYSVTLSVVPADMSDSETIESAMAQLARLVERKVPVRLSIVDELPLHAGKPQYVSSDVATDS